MKTGIDLFQKRNGKSLVQTEIEEGIAAKIRNIAEFLCRGDAVDKKDSCQCSHKCYRRNAILTVKHIKAFPAQDPVSHAAADMKQNCGKEGNSAMDKAHPSTISAKAPDIIAKRQIEDGSETGIKIPGQGGTAEMVIGNS